jgi:ferric-dicitrate binding protein FerR (iron transport regulator)
MNKNQEDIEEHLLLQYLLGNAGAETQKDIEEWLNKSKENRAHLDRLESLWLESGKLAPAPVAVDTDAAWERISKRIDNHGELKQGKNEILRIFRIPLTRYLVGAAAGFLLLFGIYAVYQRIKSTAELVELASGDQVVNDTLPDGSYIKLNSNSRLVFPEKFSHKSREVNLTGEAFFEVRHDPSLPFIIDCEKAKIIVRGTSFNVKAIPGSDMKVNVDEGMVFFFTINKQNGDTTGILLSAGMNGILRQGSTVPEMISTTSSDDLFWIDRRLIFKETLLQEVFDKISLHYKATIHVSDSLIYDCRLTATFTNESVDQILQIIAESFDLVLTREDENYLFTGDGCKPTDH